MHILAIDPGGGTGWATWQDDFKMSGQIETPSHHAALWYLLGRQHPNLIVCESFDPQTGNPAAKLVSIEYIGTVKTFADLTSTRLVMQGSAVKKWASNDKLRRAGIAHRNWHDDRHAVDAQRHILWYLCHNTFVDPTLRNATLRSLGPA